jgi:hypothetical protein
MGNHLSSQKLSNQLTSNIVGRWSEAAGDNNHIRALKSFQQGITDRRTIGDCGLTGNSKSDREKLLPEP